MDTNISFELLQITIGKTSLAYGSRVTKEGPYRPPATAAEILCELCVSLIKPVGSAENLNNCLSTHVVPVRANRLVHPPRLRV